MLTWLGQWRRIGLAIYWAQLINQFYSTLLIPLDEGCILHAVVPILAAATADAAVIHPFTQGRKKREGEMPHGHRKKTKKVSEVRVAPPRFAQPGYHGFEVRHFFMILLPSSSVQNRLANVSL